MAIVNAAHTDDNQQFSMIGVIGTLGTADTSGTALTLPIGINPTTGAMYVQDLSGASGTTNVMVVGGTLNAGTVTTTLALNNGTIDLLKAGTITKVEGGTIGRINTIGTLEVGTVTIGAINSIGTLGTLQLGTVAVTTLPNIPGGTVGVVSMLSAGTLTTIPNIPGGTLGLVTSVSEVANIAKGTITRVEGGTVGLITRVGNLGTLEVGTISAIPNIPGGTIGVVSLLSAGTITRVEGGTVGLITRVGNLGTLEVGTISALPNIPGGTIGVVSSLTTGSIVVTNGTIGAGTVAVSAGTITAGTLTRVGNIGTIESGTIRLDNVPIHTGTPFSTFATTGAAVWGTLVAASGAGTKQYVENLDIVVHSGTVDVAVTNIGVGGSTGAGVLARGAFPPGGGIQRSFFPPIASGTNGTLSYWLGGAGTVSIDIVYWQGV